MSTLFVLVIACHAKLTKECLVDYLKSKNVNDDAFESVDRFSGDAATCMLDVQKKINEIYGVTRSKMLSNFKQKPHADCAMREVEDEMYEGFMLTAEVIDMKGVGLKFWKLSSKNAKIEELHGKAQEIVDNALIKCKGQADYGAFFDAFYEQKRSEPMNDDFEYCMRKHLVDKSVVNPNLYGFKVNPKNIRVENVNCDEIMKLALEQMKESISNAGSICVINAFIENGYLDLIMKIQLFAKLQLTAFEQATEKNNFVDSMISMTHQIKACPM